MKRRPEKPRMNVPSRLDAPLPVPGLSDHAALPESDMDFPCALMRLPVESHINVRLPQDRSVMT